MAECVNPKYEDKAARGPVGGVPEGSTHAQFGAHKGPEVAADAHASVERLRAILKEAQDNIVSMTADGSLSGTIKLNNEMLAQMISKGIQDLPKEVVHALSYEAFKTALQDKEFLQHLMFVNKDGGYNWWDKSELRQWVVDLLSRSFTDEEVKEFRDGVLNVLKTDRRQIVVDAMSNCFMKRLADYDFNMQVECVIHDIMSKRAQ